ncbi:translocation/assembly module TamB domain-containing protein [Ferruginibacter paludis]|uniref:translocation/assembly module TamB domain-containing protein n=1 Tax=Ferruginibacter paludis TaxID=1310417 RepID=UPI0025B34590|nr:translocation/assembly module TamB domain-containing protein [Ferruginibacter paludis]MDN3654421.1 translocation/assembly module TamB domain-containing protein [Ferruginibacter paludis]
MTTKAILKKTGKIFLYLLCTIFFLVIAVFIYINTSSGKALIRNKLQSFLQQKLKTRVSIQAVDFSLPKWVELKGIYLEDERKDTLLYGEQISVDINMLHLVTGKIDIGKVAVKNMYANIFRPENDTTFNYQFVMNAFAGATKDTTIIADTAALKINFKKLILDDIRLKFTDNYGGNIFTAGIKNAVANLNQFQPDRMRFGVDDFIASGIVVNMVTIKEIPATATDTTAVDLFLNAGNIRLADIKVAYQNKVNGMYYANNIQHLEVTKANLNLAAENASLGDVVLDSSSIKFTAPKLAVHSVAFSAASNSNWKLAINQLSLKNDIAVYDDNNKAPQPGFDYSHIGLNKINISTGKIFYSNDTILADIRQLAFADKSGFIIDTTHAKIRYSNQGVELKELFVKTPQSVIQNQLVVKYDDVKKITLTPQNSHVDVRLKNTRIAINDIYMVAPFVKKYIPEQKFRNAFISISAAINGTLKELNIPVFQLSGLDGTTINAKAVLYNVTDSNSLAYDITIFNSSLPKSDIIKFLPANSTIELMNKLPATFSLGTHLKGNMKSSTADIDINSTDFNLQGKGTVKNIDKPASLRYDVVITNSRVKRSFIEALVPPGTIPPTVILPQLMILTGTAKGDMNNVQPNLTLRGSYGVAKVNGYVHHFKDPQKASYDLSFATQDFEVGKLIKQDSIIGALTFNGYAKGTGLDYKTMMAVVKATVKKVRLKKYDYNNILFNANLKNGDVVSDGSIDDPNIKLNYDATANVSGQYPSVQANLRLDTIQLKALNLYPDTLNASFNAFVKADNLNPDSMDVYTSIDSSHLTIKGKRYALDSIVAKATASNGKNNISLVSPMADIVANGKFAYDKIGPSLLQYIDKYYHVTDTVIRNVQPQQINFSGTIKKSPVVEGLVDGFTYENIVFKGSYASDAQDSALQLHATVPSLVYKTNSVSNGTIDITSLNKDISGAINFDTLHFGSNSFYKTAVIAAVAGDSLSITASTRDVKNNNRFVIGADIAQQNKGYTFSLKDTLMLNYKKWLVAPNNKITYSPDGILVNNFLVSYDSSKIAAASRENVLNSPIDVTISNFKIRDITSMMNSDTLLASGVINGKFSVAEFNKKLPAFTGNINADSLQFMQQPVGNIHLITEKSSENVISAAMDLTGNGNEVNVKGDYYLNDDTKQFDITMQIGNLNMTTLQAFSQGNLVNSSGRISGNIAINGKFAEPQWHGAVSFDTARFSIAKLGTTYTIDKQKISFDYPTISLDNFTVKDSANHTLVLDGEVTARSISEYNLNLAVNSTNFTLVNVAKAFSNEVYGFAAVDADISVTGNSTSPNIEGNISLNDKSDVTLVLPESNVNKDAAKSVVRFIDRDTFALPEKTPFRTAKEVKPSFAQFLNYNLNIEIGKAAALTIIIDPSTGDELKLKGDAQLNAGVDPGGNIILAGNYELSSGYYILNYQFLKKQFNLLPGSTIAFSGPPANAQINITAEYIANTSAKDLLGNEVGTVDPRLANTFKQEIPFRVLLTLKGTMLKPEISFDIELPEESKNLNISSELRTTIDNKLTQLKGDVAATNRQVFSLLLFNRFVGEQSTDFFSTGSSGGSSGGFGDLARQSVSKFLSSALDNIASDLFKGLDVDLNLNSYKDYTSGDAQQRTDLNVAVTKSFVNDRLSISVGKNFGIEGQDAAAKAAQQKGSGFLPDVTVNYKLTQDGKYLLRAYKKTQFEVILDGYVLETGVAFIVTMDYDKFRELFARKMKKVTK